MHSYALSGQWRKCADIYREMYLSPTTPRSHRYWVLNGFCSIFNHEQIIASNDDKDFLNSLSKDINTPSVERTLAGFSVGLLYWLSHEREHCVKLYKRTLKIKITEAERIIDIVDGMEVMKSCGSIFDQNLVDTQDNLSALQGQYDSNNWTHDDIAKLATPIPEYENKLGMNSTSLVRVSRAKGFTEEITRIYTDLNLKIPGSKCDSCNILRTKTTALMKCTRCKRKAYCSKECQHRDWSIGKHKLSCRAPENFKINDLVRINGIVSQPKLNGELVSIREIRDDGSVSVADISSGEAFDANFNNITLIVPVNERLDL